MNIDVNSITKSSVLGNANVESTGPQSFLQKRIGLPTYGSKYEGVTQAKRALQERTAKVPFFFGFTDSQILPLLSDATLQLWNELREKVKNSSLSSVNGTLFNQLQSSVQKDILEGELLLSDFERESLATYQKFMVRSSSNEDSLSGVNAGGNLSVGGVDPEIKALKKGIAEVVASYFGYHSLKNRSSFEDPFQSIPLCSVLIMEELQPEVSGVMMTHKPSWISQEEGTISHIAASWG